MKIGAVMASTGGNKLARCVRSFHKMEPEIDLHIVFDVSSKTWGQRNQESQAWVEKQRYVVDCNYFPGNHAHINGTLNEGMRWLARLGYDHVLLMHDDLIFSPLWRHRQSLSSWFTQVPVGSGIRFGHFEVFVADLDNRRRSEEWDKEDLESKKLWKFLDTYQRIDGHEMRPPRASFWFKYEGPDKVRPWNRLGPTAQLVPVKIWEEVGGFDEQWGIFYDQEYPSECFKRKLPPVWAVPNFPHIHLHNQSMNPWGDPAPGPWGNSMLAFEKRYGADWPGFWQGVWEQEWIDGTGLDNR